MLLPKNDLFQKSFLYTLSLFGGLLGLKFDFGILCSPGAKVIDDLSLKSVRLQIPSQ